MENLFQHFVTGIGLNRVCCSRSISRDGEKIVAMAAHSGSSERSAASNSKSGMELGLGGGRMRGLADLVPNCTKDETTLLLFFADYAMVMY